MSEVEECKDLILKTIPEPSNVISARIGAIESDDYSGYVMTVETDEDFQFGLAESLRSIKAMFSKNFFKGAEWEYEN